MPDVISTFCTQQSIVSIRATRTIFSCIYGHEKNKKIKKYSNSTVVHETKNDFAVINYVRARSNYRRSLLLSLRTLSGRYRPTKTVITRNFYYITSNQTFHSNIIGRISVRAIQLRVISFDNFRKLVMLYTHTHTHTHTFVA